VHCVSDRMDAAMPVSPPWMSIAMQGIAFWVGHRRSIYSAHELTEGALTAELCNLIHAHLDKRFRLRCEEPYRKLLPRGVTRPEVTSKARVDLSVWERYQPDGEERSRQRVQYAIEVKRASAPKALIDQDLQRLAAIVEESEGVRAFLCVISEGSRPKHFTTASGVRKKNSVPIEGTSSKYVVLNAKKASPFFENRNSAHYACVLEVLCGEDR
jgi:hypothetical protein